MDINLALLVWFVGSLLFLVVVEAITVRRGIPTISERVQQFGRSAQIVVIWASFVAGYLLCHFFE